MDPKTSDYRTVLKNKAFRVLWLNQILVQVSYTMLNFAMIVQVFSLTGRNIASSLYVLTSIIPAVLFGVVTGVFADKFDKRKILLVTDIAIGVCIISFLFAQYSVFLILIFAFLLNSAFQFFIPAEAATIPKVVAKEQLLAANALFYFILTGGALVGYSIAGPIVENFGNNYIFIFGGVAMLVGFLVRRALPALPPSKHVISLSEKRSLLRLLRFAARAAVEGIVFIRQNPRVWISVFLLVLMQLIATLLVTLGPGYMEHVLHVEATDASIVMLLPVGLGLITGTMLLGKYGMRISRRYLIVLGGFLCAVAVLCLGITPIFTAAVGERVIIENVLHTFSQVLPKSFFVAAFCYVLGFAGALMMVPAQTVLQNATTEEIRGRVFSVLELLKASAVAVPILAAGSLADLFGIVPIIISMGVVLLLLDFIFYRFVAFEKYFR